MVPGESWRGNGEGGPLSSAVKMGESMAKKEGDGVSGVRGDRGETSFDLGDCVRGDMGLGDDKSIRTIVP